MSSHAESHGLTNFQEKIPRGACIKVISVGGGGNNAINRMIDLGVEGVEFISINTDLQSLRSSQADVRLQIGAHLTHGLGAGTNPEIGRRAALDESHRIVKALEGADMVFITAGLGGGTGTGVAPVVASAASRMGALTVAIVTLPFAFEGKRRMNQAEQGLHDLLDYVDTLIVIPNDRLLVSGKDMGFFDSFHIADDVLRQAVQGISDIITIPGVINRDFADIKATMAGMGYAVMGTASRSGPNRASEAALAAIASPLLVAGAIEGARGILINISGSSSLTLSEVHEASTVIQSAAHDDANIIFGAALDEQLGGEIKITVIAAGFHQDSRERAQRRLAARSVVEPIQASHISQGLPLSDVVGQVSIAREPQPEGPEPSLSAAAAMDLEETSSIGAAPQSLAPESLQSSQVNHDALGTFTDEDPSLLAVGVLYEPVGELLEQGGEDSYEENLLTFLDGLPFDSNPISDEPVSSRSPETVVQTEVAKVRQAAIAAYAALSITAAGTGDKDSEPTATKAASFAEILEIRQQHHIGDETASDYRSDDEATLHQEPATSTDALPGRVQAFSSEPDTTSSLKDETREQPADKTSIDLSMTVGGPTPPSGSAPTPANTPVARSSETTSPTPDFNRKLNREPDFSMGIKAI